MPNRIDSNVTGLQYCEESSAGVLPGTPVWRVLNPNSYSDFGGQVKTTARNPINAGRQRKKGAVTDLDASGGFQVDMVQRGINGLIQSFFFAAAGEKFTTAPISADSIALTATTTTTYTAAAGLGGVLANHLLVGGGFANAANNGLHLAASASNATTITTTGLVVETPTTDAWVAVCGYQFAIATLDMVISGTYPRLTRASGVFDFTTLNLRPGEWIFIGGDTPATLAFSNAVNNGFARVRSVGTSYIELDKTQSTPVAETGTGRTIQIFFGTFLRNEKTSSLITRKFLQFERQLGNDGNGTQSEYLVGCLGDEMKISVPSNDKVTVDFSFVGMDSQFRTGLQGVKSGTRKNELLEEAFNTSSDVSRIRLSTVQVATAPTPLFAYATKLELTVKNNVSPTKAIGTLGAIDQDIGDFQVSGSLEVFFADTTSVNAVRNYSDVTMDFAIAKNGAGFVFDVPLMGLGNGRVTIEKDKSIKLPLTADAFESYYGFTLGYTSFPYLPALAH